MVAERRPDLGIPVAVEARGLEHRYGARRALDPLSFALAAPGVVAVTGPNGSGKSTLLRIIAGLLRPSAGELAVTIDGVPRAPRARRDGVGFASSELAFYEELSALENLTFAAESRGLGTPGRRALEALARCGLGPRARDRAGALSSGMKQRLRLAFALLADPPLLVLDEPGTHLDDDGQALVAHLIAESGRAGLVILATNDEREWRLAGQRIELRRGPLGHPA
jgi:heme exporter protein A